MTIRDQYSVGDRVHSWTILSMYAVKEGGLTKQMAKCRCECGAVHDVGVHNIHRGLSKGCRACARKKTALAKMVYTKGKVLDTGARIVSRESKTLVIQCKCGERFESLVNSIKRHNGVCTQCRRKPRGQVLARVDGNGFRLSDCMELLGVSRQRVSQIEKSGRLHDRIVAALGKGQT